VPSSSDPSAAAREPSLAAPVRLSVPAAARYLSSARLVAASLGAESGLSVDDLDDLRLGVNELVSLLMEAAGDGGRIDLEFDVGDGAVTVRGELDGAAALVELDELTGRILAAVTDHHELDGTSFSLIKGSSLRDDR
jgi:anti-sigma regulatory factor (Ser/Thr protein kinase)